MTLEASHYNIIMKKIEGRIWKREGGPTEIGLLKGFLRSLVV